MYEGDIRESSGWRRVMVRRKVVKRPSMDFRPGPPHFTGAKNLPDEVTRTRGKEQDP
jgi:hypothetical protein